LIKENVNLKYLLTIFMCKRLSDEKKQ